MPNSLFLDGVSTATYPVPHGADPDPTQITLSPSNNWAITLALRNSESTVKICTLLTQDGKWCNTSPSGALNSSKVYFEAGQSDLVGIDDFDRTDAKGKPIGARIHYTVPYCTLSDGSAGNDSDTDCDKISTVTINLGDGSSPTVYTCIDGACDIKIDDQ
jgi:hypothetical protein